MANLKDTIIDGNLKADSITTGVINSIYDSSNPVPLTINTNIDLNGSLDIFHLSFSGASSTASLPGLTSIGGSNVIDFGVEYGGSNGWEYRKWKSGVAECWGNFRYSNIAINTAFGGTFYSGNFGNQTFPSNLFKGTPKVFVDIQDGTYGAWLMRGSTHPSRTQTGAQNACRGTAVTIPSLTLSYYCIGAWE